MRADLIIVGAGMVGSALALALQDSDLDILLLDGGPLQLRPFDPQAAFEPRVSALSAASQRILERLGAWPGILGRRATPYRDMRVWDGSGTGSLHFSAAHAHAEWLGHIVENRIVQDALLERLQAGRLRLLGDARLTALQRQDGDWQLQLADGRQLHTPLLIAADGAQSAVRQLAGCATREWDYLHHAIVTSVRCAEPHQATAWQRFTDQGPLAFLPLQRGDDRHWCSIVWSTVPDQAQRLMALDDAAFCTALERAFEGRLGALGPVDPRFSIPLRQRHAQR
ncbi:TPA: FAD-dependent monooxygenase, partial [Klebsiella pneumoniae]